MGNHGWSDLGCYSDNSTSLPAKNHSQLWQGIQWTLCLCFQCHLDLHHWCIPPCWHSLPPGVPPCRGGCGWLTSFELLQRKEALHPGLICTACRCVAGWFHHLPLHSLLHCLEIIGIHLLITTCLEVCHHCFKLLRHSIIEVITLQFSNVIWQKALWEQNHKDLEVPWQMYPPIWHHVLLAHSQLEELLVQNI